MASSLSNSKRVLKNDDSEESDKNADKNADNDADDDTHEEHIDRGQWLVGEKIDAQVGHGVCRDHRRRFEPLLQLGRVLWSQ